MDAEQENDRRNNLDESEEDSESHLDSDPDSEKCLIGFVTSQIVGMKFYKGKFRGREIAELERDPLDSEGPNAIKVMNMRAIQVGNIERMAAAVLAPLIDQNLIAVQGVVPKVAKGRSRSRIPIQVHIFSLMEEFGRVESELSKGGLHLIAQNEEEFTLSEEQIVKETQGWRVHHVDEIFNLVNERVSKKELEKMEPRKDIIKSELLPHQKEGLGWLVQKETTNDLTPFWPEVDESASNRDFRIRPGRYRGGILADDMGLGKTLTLLSLIAFDKPMKNPKKKQKVMNQGQKTTLVVCPPSVISTWVTQLEDHTIQGTLKMYMYYGERCSDPKELEKYDIVLTTYATLVSEDSLKESPLKQIEWWRIILDEAHVIRNVNTKQSKAVNNLKGELRWAVTGTPIQNGFSDIFGFMKFLRFEPFSSKYGWNLLVSKPLAQGCPLVLARLQALVAAISLRRTKEDNLTELLPEKSIETCYVELSSCEREMYDRMEEEARNIISSYISESRLSNNYMTVLSIILRLRQICIDPTLCPADLKNLLPTNEIEDVKNKPELLQKMVALLQEGEDFDCPICITPTKNMVITCCAHVFCRSCILKTLKRTARACPLCRHPLTESDLFSAPPETNTANASTSNISSKVSQLLKLLNQSRTEDPSTKSVIFSQFRKMLILLEEPLRDSGFKILRIDGSMNAKKRGTVIKEFVEADGSMVLLASLRASGVGINLTAASRVYFLEPWWNPAVEEQAMDRVHRIGQTKKVKIVRLIVKDTVEDRILELQENKKADARDLFEDGGRRIKVDNIRSLISLE